MKKVAFPILAIALITLFGACKNESKEIESTPENIDLAVADNVPVSSEAYLYVTAPSGLTLREHSNLNSEKLAIMPYGTKLKVITHEKENTMNVAGVSGAMNEVEYNLKTGYAFNGFLSKFFPPERDMNAKMYVEDLKIKFPETSYSETTGGTASSPTKTETIVLPTENWHEAFYIAQKLYDIPMSFTFPNPKGKEQQTVSNVKKTKEIWLSDVTVLRKDNSLQKITYSEASERMESSVVIIKEGEAIKISKNEIIK